MLCSPPGDPFVGFPYGDLGEIGLHGYTMFLRDAALPLSIAQVCHVRSREDPKGSIATLRWNDLGLNGNPTTQCSGRIDYYGNPVVTGC